MSRCVVSIVVRIVVLRSCSCCCHWRTVVFAITVYCCILFFVLFFLFLLLLLLSVVCRQHLLLSRRPSFVVIRLPLLVAITVYCCFVCVALCRLFANKKNIEFYLKKIELLYSLRYFLGRSAFIQFAGPIYILLLFSIIYFISVGLSRTQKILILLCFRNIRSSLHLFRAGKAMCSGISPFLTIQRFSRTLNSPSKRDRSTSTSSFLDIDFNSLSMKFLWEVRW